MTDEQANEVVIGLGGFVVGDRVRIIQSSLGTVNTPAVGQHGTVVDVYHGGAERLWTVEIGDASTASNSRCNFYRDELELAN